MITGTPGRRLRTLGILGLIAVLVLVSIGMGAVFLIRGFGYRLPGR